MKAGDTITVTDSSWSKHIINSKLERAWANRLPIWGQHWAVVQTGCSFPLDRDLKQPPRYRNDTIIQGPDGGIVFIHSRFLEVVPPHVWKNGDVFTDEGGGHPKVYIHVYGRKPQVFHLSNAREAKNGEGLAAPWPVSDYTDQPGVEFLFNIKDKL